MRKNSVFRAFCMTVPQKLWENSVFHVFETLCIKFAKNEKKTGFFKLFARRPTKSVRKQCFSRFWDTLYKVRKKMRWNSVFWAFCTTSHEKCEKTVFFHVFRGTLDKVRRKCEKQRFLSFLIRLSTKSVRKQCSFTFFRDILYKKFAKNTKKHRFLSFLHDIPQKVWETVFFMFFEALCTKFAENTKNSVFWAFWTTFHKKCEKTVFFHVFRDILYKVCKKYEKTSFYELFFARHPTKSVRKQCFSCFSRHFVQSLQKMRKNSGFLSFSHDVPQKVWENSFFHVFRDTLYKVCKKC